jgi:hypothetical protein
MAGGVEDGEDAAGVTPGTGVAVSPGVELGFELAADPGTELELPEFDTDWEAERVNECARIQRGTKNPAALKTTRPSTTQIVMYRPRRFDPVPVCALAAVEYCDGALADGEAMPLNGTVRG